MSVVGLKVRVGTFLICQGAEKSDVQERESGSRGFAIIILLSATMPVDHTTESTDGPPVVIRNHPIYYFDDGSLILDIDTQRFKIHRSLLARHSGFFCRSADMLSNSEMIPSSSTSGLLGLLDGVPRIVLGHSRPVRPEDVEALLQHFYHDV